MIGINSRLVMMAAMGMTAASATITARPDADIKSLKPKHNSARAIYQRVFRLNRSRRWKHADTYQTARNISPFPERPVR